MIQSFSCRERIILSLDQALFLVRDFLGKQVTNNFVQTFIHVWMEDGPAHSTQTLFWAESHKSKSVHNRILFLFELLLLSFFIAITIVINQSC